MLRYAITDRTQLGADEPSRRAALLDCAARWVREQIDFVQLREKDLPLAAQLALCRELSAVLHVPGSRTRLLLNTANVPPAMALEAGADGIHLTAAPDTDIDSPRPAQLRPLFAASGRPNLILSASCHTLAQVSAQVSAQAGAATRAGVDLILFGPVFGKTIPTPDGGSRTVTPAVGLEALRAACAAARGTPVLALGGITRENTPACLEAGAAGIAAIRLFQSAM